MNNIPAKIVVFRCIRYFDLVEQGNEPLDKDRINIVVEMAKNAIDRMGKELISEQHTKSS